MTESQPSRYCLKCHYPLHALPEPRCPECGREFDPDNPASWDTNPSSRTWRRAGSILKYIIHPAVLLGIGWYIHHYLSTYETAGPNYRIGNRYLLGFSGLLILIGIVFLCFRKKGGLLLIFANPASLYSLVAAIGYWTGTGYYYSGLTIQASYTQLYFCPESRLPFRDYLPGLHWDAFQITCNNVVLEKLGEWFGPAPGTYSGPIPDYKQAADILTLSTEIDIRDLLRNKVVINNRIIPLEDDFSRPFIPENLDPTEREIYINTYAPEIIRHKGPPWATIYDDSCLLIMIPTIFERMYYASEIAGQRCNNDTWEIMDIDGTIICLVDVKTGIQFAQYSYGDIILFGH